MHCLSSRRRCPPMSWPARLPANPAENPIDSQEKPGPAPPAPPPALPALPGPGWPGSGASPSSSACRVQAKAKAVPNPKRVGLNRVASKLRGFDGESPPEKLLRPSTRPDMCTSPGLSCFVESAASESESWRPQTLLGILLLRPLRPPLRPAWNLPDFSDPQTLLFFSRVGLPEPLA